MVNSAEKGHDMLIEHETSVANVEESAVSMHDGPPIRVLIIDGHEAVRRALRIRLSVPIHFQIVDACPYPANAADMIHSKRPDVVLLGLHRSSNRELALVARSVSDMAKEAAKVIVLAPFADAVERETLLNAGAKRYLLKHINSDQLIHEIELVVAGVAGD